MTDKHSLIAFVVLVTAICYLATVAGYLSLQGKYAEALGFGGLTTGLVGVLGTFRPKQSDSGQTVAKADTVNQVQPAQPE